MKTESLAKCPCTTCSGKLEFESHQAGQAITCPHCGIETVLFVPYIAPPPVVAPKPIDPALKYCPHCGTIARGHTFTPGSFAIELVLWALLIVPGICYSIWRLSSRTHTACPACNQPGMIPANSPRALQLTARA